MKQEINDCYKKNEKNNYANDESNAGLNNSNNNLSNNELIIMYPQEQLENIITKLKDFGFVETEKNRIDLGNKIIANLRYEGKISFENTIDKIKEQGIEYEIPGRYNILKKDKPNFDKNYLV